MRLAWWLTVLLAHHEQDAGRERTVMPGETLWGIARHYGCSVGALRDANAIGGAPLPQGVTLRIPRECRRSVERTTWTAQHGDTLSHVAARHGTTVAALKAHNNLQSSRILAGQRLKIPPKATDVEKIRFVAGQSVGKPFRGRLVDGAQLPYDPSYYRRRPTQAYAATHVVDRLRAVIFEVRTRHPGLHRLAVGDLSARRGGPIREHRSHQSGRDVDVGLYFEQRPEGYPEQFAPARAGTLALGPLWDFVATLHAASSRPGGPEYVFLDYRIQLKIYAYARRHGASRELLKKILQAPEGPGARDRFVQHVKNHHDHMHVRFACLNDDTRCR